MATYCRLYGNVYSVGTMRVLASLYEHDVEFEFVQIDPDDEHYRTQISVALDPFGEASVFQDGEMTLFESRAIMRCLSHAYAKQGQEQVYEVPKMQGIATSWIDVEDHHFDPPAAKLIAELVEKPRKGLPADQEVVSVAVAELAAVLDVYEARLTESKLLGGDKFTAADLTHLPNLHYLMALPVCKTLFESRPHVYAWSNAILSRLAWKKVVEMQKPLLKSESGTGKARNGLDGTLITEDSGKSAGLTVDPIEAPTTPLTSTDKLYQLVAKNEKWPRIKADSIEDEAWNLLHESIVYYWNPVGTIAAND
ncbi:hypothetical protein Nepgr_032839 [Nepenthes gracilis]|uniref:glutathione transferase n=1 Tax=Nepenthes gracilis TaxID=150966 RepID=A0AAD3TKZ8_NEPGR|nr:hypothetical protein Nepgr_032839 [Nepenthes gracilis]